MTKLGISLQSSLVGSERGGTGAVSEPFVEEQEVPPRGSQGGEAAWSGQEGTLHTDSIRPRSEDGAVFILLLCGVVVFVLCVVYFINHHLTHVVKG